MEEICLFDDSSELDVPAMSCREGSFPLNALRLEKGKYVLVISGYKTRFEIADVSINFSPESRFSPFLDD